MSQRFPVALLVTRGEQGTIAGPGPAAAGDMETSATRGRQFPEIQSIAKRRGHVYIPTSGQ